MRSFILTATAAVFILGAQPARAAEVVASGGVVTALTQGGGAAATGTGYTGAGGGLLGAVTGGIGDTFDAFGFYNAGVGSLAVQRRTELLAGNTYRFFDTFTNTTGARVRTTVSFFGNLGSDGDELVQLSKPGLMVSCQGDFDTLTMCDEDAVVALVSGNTGLGRAEITPDRYTVRFDLDLAAGESVSLLNFATLALTQGGPNAGDVTRATAAGEALLARPDLSGLSTAERARIVNFAAAVPEPASWAMMIAGFALVGGARRRRVAAIAA